MDMQKKGNSLLVALAFCLPVLSSNLYAQDFELGAGLGIPYGILGANIEYYPIDNVSVSLGLGTTVVAGAAHDIGLQYYFGTKGSWSPRISVHSGTNGAIKLTTCYFGCTDEGHSYTGTSLGFGVKKLWGHNGIAGDLFYIVTSGVFDAYDNYVAQGYAPSGESSNSRVKIGIAYIHDF